MSESLIWKARQAFQEGRYQDAIQLFEDFCQANPDPKSPEYIQAQVGLVKAYQQSNQLDKAAQLSQTLTQVSDQQIQNWAQKKLEHLNYLGATQPSMGLQQALPPVQSQPARVSESAVSPQNQVSTLIPSDQAVAAQSIPSPEGLTSNQSSTSQSSDSSIASSMATTVDQPSGSRKPTWVKVPITQQAGPLKVAIIGTTGVIIGLVIWILMLPHSRLSLFQQFLVVLSVVLNVGSIAFFLAPRLQDFIQAKLYNTRWITTSILEKTSPAAVKSLYSICTKFNLKIPQLGLINTPIPVAFAYGSIPDQSRLVVSQGLLNSLDDTEIAAVYAQQMGKVVTYETAVLTVISLIGQLSYLAYGFTSGLNEGRGKNRQKDIVLGNLAPPFYALFLASTFPLFPISRLGEFYADHLATEATGDPNALARSLIKIAYGMAQETRKLPRPSLILEGTRLFGLVDPKTATIGATAYQAQTQPDQVRQIFLWDLVNPWAKGMQLNSSHPLMGQRMQALGQYAQRLRMVAEFEMNRIQAESRSLNHNLLFGQFRRDTIFYTIEISGLIVGWVIGLGLFFVQGRRDPHILTSTALMGLGLGLMVKAFVMFPKPKDPVESTVVALIANPYASPRSDQLVTLKGSLSGRGRIGFQLGSELRLEDDTGMIPVRFSSRLGPIGNLLTGMKPIRALSGRSEVVATGWLRRGIAPWFDLIRIGPVTGKPVNSYPRMWLLVFGSSTILVGGLLLRYYPFLISLVPGWLPF